jgi:amino-acid N-acetyltransferase
VTIRGQGRNYFRPALHSVQTLLREAQLPTQDLTAAHLEHFIACRSDDALDGVVGLEMYVPYALLRSLAVAPAKRGNGIGQAMLAEAERYARHRGAQEIYLLTTSAESFFRLAHYARVARDDVPPAIRRTTEFTTLCPASAVAMRKMLRPPK